MYFSNNLLPETHFYADTEMNPVSFLIFNAFTFFILSEHTSNKNLND